MKFLRFLIVPLLAGVLLTAVGSYDAAAVAAQDKQTTQTDETKTTTTTGFPTGTKCTKTGIYRADNKYLTIIRVFEEGEEFPAFIDGQKITWYALAPSTKSFFDAVKVSAGSN